MSIFTHDFMGYFRLGVAARVAGNYQVAARYFASALRLNPRNPSIKNLYWCLAVGSIFAGHDREGLEWADRTMTAEGDLPSSRARRLLTARAVAHYRTGDVDTAKRLVAELNERYPFDTWRAHFPLNPDSAVNRE